MPPRHFDAVVFDLDGVLTDTARVHAAAWKDLFDGFLSGQAKSKGTAFIPFDSQGDYLRHVDGKPRYDGVRSFLASRGIALAEAGRDGEETVRSLGDRKDVLFRNVLQREGVPVVVGSVALVESLRKQGIPCAVASSSKNCRLILQLAGLDAMFVACVDGVVSQELGLSGKPSPDIFIEAARRAGSHPSRTVVVEDALAGVEAGRRGGFRLVVGVDRAGIAAELRSAGADVVLSGFEGVDARALDEWCRAVDLEQGREVRDGP
jgi:beta-phosphoglucomutase family hydrolase